MKNITRFITVILITVALLSITNTSSAQRGRGGFGGGHFGGGFFGGARFGGTRFVGSIGYRPRILPFGRMYSLPSSYLRIRFGGMPYYFVDGLYYASYGDYYGLVAPPFGLTIGLLPRGYWGFSFGGYPYFYHSGIFYRSTNDNKYQVVQAPVGAEVPALPKDAKPIVINDVKLYEYLGTYYKEVVGEDGKVKYMVQGKDGVLNTNSTPEVSIENNSNNNAPAAATIYTPSIGDIVLQLPSQTKIVIVNGKKLFVTPEHVYYEEFVDGNTLKYKIVGM